jgi:carotenoid 1,2-hydratase
VDGAVPAPSRRHTDCGAVPGGGQRASGTGSADGGDVGAARGRHADGSPRFDAPVEPGAYLWWYVDALSDDGRHALTLIAFVGSVFSPYYRRAWRAGRARADEHCALNVCLYSPGASRWTMTERAARHVERGRTYFRIGPSAMCWRDGVLEVEIDEVANPLPRRVRGTVRVQLGALSTFVATLDDAGRHRWGPIAPCARVQVRLDAPDLSWDGHAYVDSNEGDEPISEPFTTWDWMRATLQDGSCVVAYDVRQARGRADRLIGRRFYPHGADAPVDLPERVRLPSTRWGIARHVRAGPTADGRGPAVLRTLEDTPFYARGVVQGQLCGEPVQAMHETLDAGRFASPVVQLMLPWRMPRRG